MPPLEHLGGSLEEGTREDCLNLPGMCGTGGGHCSSGGVSGMPCCSLLSPILLHKQKQKHCMFGLPIEVLRTAPGTW